MIHPIFLHLASKLILMALLPYHPYTTSNSKATIAIISITSSTTKELLISD
jgi:hypothetical protein